MAWNVLILGGGFGGLTAARKLERLLPHASAGCTLINDVNFMLYTPLLPGAAGGTLEPRHVVVPLREELKSTHLRLARVTAADPTRNAVTIVNPEDDDEARHSLLSYVFVGAGYAGVEGLAELQDFAADVLELYPRCRLHGLRFVLVEARDRLMPEISEGLAEFAGAELRRRGIEIRLSTTIERVSAESTELSDGEVIPTRTVAWTAGVTPHPIVARLGLPLDGAGRIKVDRYCQVEGFDDVWAIGDAAAVPDPARPGQPSPPTCQHAIRQGRTVATNVAAALGDGHKRPFTYRTLGVFVDMGRHQAVAETLK